MKLIDVKSGRAIILFISVLFVCLLSASSYAISATLVVKVTDPMLGTPCSDATVKLDGTVVGVTDMWGELVVDAVASWRTVTVSKDGYYKFERSVQVIDNETTKLQMFLNKTENDTSGGGVSGTITNVKTGQGVGGAVFKVQQGTAGVSTGTANDQGRFAMPWLNPGESTLLVTGEDFYSVNQGITVEAGYSSHHDLFTVPKTQEGTGAVAGCVKHLGEPSPGARVTLENSTGAVTVTETDENGQYSFAGLTPGDYYTITVEQGGTEIEKVTSLEVLPDETNNQNFELEKASPGAQVTITVIDEKDEAPIAGAEVRAGDEPPLTTAEDGNVQFEDVSPGDFVFSVWAKGFEAHNDTIKVDDGGKYVRTVPMKQTTGTIWGRIFNSDFPDTGIPGATVTLSPGGQTTVSTSQGHFTFDSLPPGSYTVHVARDGFKDVEMSAEVRAIETTQLKIYSSAVANLSGKVENTDGDAVEGAIVSFGEDNSVETGSDGNFLFEDNESGEYELHVSKDGYEDHSETVTISGSEDLEKTVTLVRSTGAILVKVSDINEDESRLEGVTVTLSPGGLSAVTNPYGEVWFNDVEPGTYTLTAVKDGYKTVEASTTVEGAETKNVTLYTSREIDVKGTVVNIYGNPVPDAQVNVEPGGYRTITGDDGTFNLPDLLAGKRFIININAPDYNPGAALTGFVSDNTTNTVSVQLEPKSTGDAYISGKLVDSNGQPVDGADLFLNGDSVGQTDGDGNFLINNPPGTYVLTVSADGYRETQELVTFSDSQTFYNRLEISPADGGGNVSGILWSADDAPVNGWNVALSNGETTQSDADGAFIFTDVPVGDYSIVASNGDEETAPVWLTVDDGATSDPVIFVGQGEAPLAIQGTVRDSETGTKIDGALVTVEPGGYSAVAENGIFSVNDPPAASNYTVTVTKDSYRDCQVFNVLVNDAGPAPQLDVQLPPEPLPEVTGVSAKRMGWDDGGAVIVSWAPYPASDKICQFDIYRSQNLEFTLAFNSLKVSDINTDSEGRMSAVLVGTVSMPETCMILDMTADMDVSDYYYWVQAVAKDGRTSGFAPSSVMLAVEEPELAPEEIALTGNYPNPFNPTTEIRYYLPESGHVKLSVYSVSGQLVETLIDGTVGEGAHQAIWSPDTEAAGVYFCVLESAGTRLMKKMTLLK